MTAVELIWMPEGSWTPPATMTATFTVHLRGASPTDLMAQWGEIINYLRRIDGTVSSVCRPIAFPE